MATLHARLLPLLDRARAKLTTAGLRRYTVTRRLVTWDSGEVGRGNPTYSDLVLSPNPKVQETGAGQLTVGHITPSHATGGYTAAQLRPLTGDPAAAEDPGQEFYYLLSGPQGEERYALTGLTTSDGPARGEGTGSFRYTLTLQALDRAGP